jgi:hypothetical protein
MRITEVVIHEVNSAAKLQDTLHFPFVTGVECDLRHVPCTEVIGLHHGSASQVRGRRVGSVLEAMYQRQSLFTLGDMAAQAPGLRILGHIKADQPYEGMLRLIHDQYVPNTPGLDARLSFCGENIRAMQTARSIMPQSLIIWSINRMDDLAMRPRSNDGIYIKANEQELTKAARLGFSIVNIGRVKTAADVAAIEEYMERTGRNYFRQVWIETDHPGEIARAFIPAGQSLPVTA